MSPSKHSRVLMIVENLPLPFDRRVWQEALALREAGYQVSIICPKGHGFAQWYELLAGIHIYRHPLPVEADTAMGYALEYGLSLAWEFMLAMRIALTRGFDIIHACNPPDTIFLVARVFKLFGKRFIFDHHDINPELYEAKFGRRGPFHALLLLLERWTYKAADVSIATNESFRRIAIERGHMSPDNVFVVRSGPDIAEIPVGLPQTCSNPGRVLVIGYVGVIGKQDGLDLLLAAAVHLRDTFGRRDFRFMIIGDGTELKNLQEIARLLGLQDYVAFLGRITGRAMWETLSTADICVSPDRVNSMNDKSTMNKVIEYMALGKPIVQFELTEGRYSAGEASLYAKPNDAEDFARQLCVLLDDAPLRDKMGRIGRARVEDQLAWHHQVPRLLAAYELALAGKR